MKHDCDAPKTTVLNAFHYQTHFALCAQYVAVMFPNNCMTCLTSKPQKGSCVNVNWSELESIRHSCAHVPSWRSIRHVSQISTISMVLAACSAHTKRQKMKWQCSWSMLHSQVCEFAVIRGEVRKIAKNFMIRVAVVDVCEPLWISQLLDASCSLQRRTRPRSGSVSMWWT